MLPKGSIELGCYLAAERLSGETSRVRTDEGKGVDITREG